MRPRRATQADVAELAGVSVATVSYVASGRRDRKNPATPEIAARVLEAMRELDYMPARAGRVLAKNRTGLIAVATHAPVNPWTLGVIDILEEVAADHEMGVVIQYGGRADGAFGRIERHLLEGLADAVVILGAGDFGTDRLYRIGKHVPLLAMGETFRPRGFDVMVQREQEASVAAAKHLIELGVRRPAYLLHGHTPGARHPRMDGFVDTFLDHGIPRRAITIAEDRDDAFAGFLDARHVATDLLERPRAERPDAIMAFSDRAAISAIWAATQLGISVPDELKVIGAGNIPEGTALEPALTTIGSDVEEYRPVLERLVRRIDRPETRTKTLSVPWRLILRGTA